jgi:formate dehydrogenase iron-sulfur subunit
MATPSQVGFLTDTTVCIGCKACEVACKEWNQLDSQITPFTGDSYDNTGQLDANNWRHVKFVEQPGANEYTPGKWLMMSDVCKHCTDAPCANVCPTGAIVRTEFDTVYIQQNVCNGCQNCISACPFGVIGSNPKTGLVNKCTFCYDRLQNNLGPACAKACPTSSIQWGEYGQMLASGKKRVQMLQDQGVSGARLYGDKELGGLRSLFVLTDKPEVYGLPTDPKPAVQNTLPGSIASVVTVGVGLLGALFALRRRGSGGGDGSGLTREEEAVVKAGEKHEPQEVKNIQNLPEVPNA